MALQFCNRLVERIVEPVHRVLVRLCRPALADRPLLHHGAQVFPKLGVVRDSLGNDIACARKRIFDCLDAEVRVDIVLRQHLGRVHLHLLLENRLRQRLESFFLGNRCARATLLLVGPVEIFDLGQRRGIVDRRG